MEKVQIVIEGKTTLAKLTALIQVLFFYEASVSFEGKQAIVEVSKERARFTIRALRMSSFTVVEVRKIEKDDQKQDS